MSCGYVGAVYEADTHILGESTVFLGQFANQKMGKG